ncbi:hypothetical protein RRG08_043071 [Elysia crispata]|uniref:Uncharacterized protein n=1 Tax=Elysia crispata TaxID=231223 RepID=A0AAE0XYV6_9GAST|nr:hypothetical protein RRG08_043071 [Elysia crispata]
MVRILYFAMSGVETDAVLSYRPDLMFSHPITKPLLGFKTSADVMPPESVDNNSPMPQSSLEPCGLAGPGRHGMISCDIYNYARGALAPGDCSAKRTSFTARAQNGVWMSA